MPKFRPISASLSRLFLVALAFYAWTGSTQAEDRLWLEGIQVNRKPVRLIFDTGASDLFLFQQGAVRLGLTYSPPAKDSVHDSEFPVGRTEETDLQMGSQTIKIRFNVIELPAGAEIDADGVIGWGAVEGGILVFDMRQKTIRSLPKVPEYTTNWVKFKLLADSGQLRMEAPGPADRASEVMIDTGDESGIGFPHDQWQDWKLAHTNQPMTLDSFYTPAAGTVVCEESWADSLAIGELLLKNVPVHENMHGKNAAECVTFGLAALRRLDLIVDTKGGFAYLRSNESPPREYEHNRLGTVFVPSDLEKGDDIIAHVLRGGPGWEAGIRDGDVLLRVGDRDYTKWQTDPHIGTNNFTTLPAGTKLDFVLRRDGEEFKTQVTLKQILPPEPNLSENVPHK